MRDAFSRYTLVYYIRHKSDAVELFGKFLAYTRADDVPSEVVIVHSDGGIEFHRGGGGLKTCVKPDFTTTVSPLFN